MSTPTETTIQTADEVLQQHRIDRLDIIREAMEDHDDDPESALNYVESIARQPLYYRPENIELMMLEGALPVFEEDEVYVPAGDLTDQQILERARKALEETGWDDVRTEPLRITWRGHVLLLAEHSDGGDIAFWFRRVQPDDRAIVMAHVG